MAVFWLTPIPAVANASDEIDQRNRQIEEIERQVQKYQAEIEAAGGRARTLSDEISRLNASISKVMLEIKSLGLAIQQTAAEIVQTEGRIKVAEEKLDLQKRALAKYLQILDQNDARDLTAVLFRNGRLSDFFNNLRNLEDTQKKAKTAIINIKGLKSDLEQKKTELEDKKEELQQLKGLQEAQRKGLETDRKTKDQLLKETKGQEAKFQQLIKRSQEDIERIRDQIQFLEQNGVTVEDAIKFGQLAAIRVGIRPAFLIAVLEVESGLGRNVGTGNWLTDMYKCYLKLGRPERAESEKSAFLEIVNKLGLNPDSVKVSREPNYGCGGALGPAQFLPTTWLGYEEEVIRLTGHNPPSPWSIEDAFMASAVKLSKAGASAKTKATEVAAAKAYLSGNAKCIKRICNYYANAVLSKAAEIERNL